MLQLVQCRVEGVLVRGGNCEADMVGSRAAGAVQDANKRSLATNEMVCAQAGRHATKRCVSGWGNEARDEQAIGMKACAMLT